MKVKWSRRAFLHLEEIFNYYAENASVKIAEEIRDRILQRVQVLADYPMIGTVEWELSMNEKYRFLMFSHWKILYKLSIDHVQIVGILDVRHGAAQPSDFVEEPQAQYYSTTLISTR